MLDIRMIPALLTVLVATVAAEESLAFICPAVNATHTCTCSNQHVNCNTLGVTNLNFIGTSASAIVELSASKNELLQLPASFLAGATNLIKLNLSHNKINSIDATSFESLKSVFYLDLSHNRLKEFYLPVHALPSLRGLNLMYNSLVHLRIDNNRPIIFDQLFLSHNQIQNNLEFLQNITRVRLLSLGSNAISNVTLSTFPNPSYLLCLRINNNSLSNLHFLKSTEILSELDVSKNYISSIPESAFLNLKSLKILSVSGNEISDLKFLSNITSEIEVLDLSVNNISSINFSYLENKNKLHYVDVSHNKLKNLNFATKIKHLKTLLADENEISEIDTTIFSQDYSWGKALKNFSLNNNLISDLKFMSNLRNMSVLNLRNNSIAHIPEDTLSQLINLTSLDLSINKISDVNFVSHASVLRSLNLSHNMVENLPCSDFLEQLFLNGNNITSLQLNCVPNLRYITIYEGGLRDRKYQVLEKSREVLLEMSGQTVMFPCLPPIDMILKCRDTGRCSPAEAKAIRCNIPYNHISMRSPVVITLLSFIIPVGLIAIFCLIMKYYGRYRRKARNSKKCLCEKYVNTHQPLPRTEQDLEAS